MKRWWLGMIGVGACTGEVIPDRDPDTNETIECDDPITIDVTVTGLVTNEASAALAGAEVALLDVAAAPIARFGATTTGGDGRFTLNATGLVWFPNCNLLFTDYTMRATTEAGDSGDDDINFELFQVIEDNSLRIDMSTAITVEAG